jgi:hypothetical protein
MNRLQCLVAIVTIICGSLLLFALGYAIWSYNLDIEKAAIEHGMIQIRDSYIPAASMSR